MSPLAQQIVNLVQNATTQNNAFLPIGPGQGNQVTNAVMAQANQAVREQHAGTMIEYRFAEGIQQNFDYFIPQTYEAIEVELSLSNPYPCLQKDSLKVLLARYHGQNIQSLILVGDPGSRQRMNAPAQRALLEYFRVIHGLNIEISELH